MNAQIAIDSLTYENTQDIEFFKKIKNKTLIKKYKTINGNVIKVGDIVVLGNTTNQELSSKTYEFVKMGRLAGFGSIMTAMNGDAQVMTNNSLKNTKAIVKEIKAYRRASKKKPLYVIMVLGEMNEKALGINKYLSVMDTEFTIESGEILLKNRKITREEAIL